MPPRAVAQLTAAAMTVLSIHALQIAIIPPTMNTYQSCGHNSPWLPVPPLAMSSSQSSLLQSHLQSRINPRRHCAKGHSVTLKQVHHRQNRHGDDREDLRKYHLLQRMHGFINLPPPGSPSAGGTVFHKLPTVENCWTHYSIDRHMEKARLKNTHPYNDTPCLSHRSTRFPASLSTVAHANVGRMQLLNMGCLYSSLQTNDSGVDNNYFENFPFKTHLAGVWYLSLSDPSIADYVGQSNAAIPSLHPLRLWLYDNYDINFPQRLSRGRWTVSPPSSSLKSDSVDVFGNSDRMTSSGSHPSHAEQLLDDSHNFHCLSFKLHSKRGSEDERHLVFRGVVTLTRKPVYRIWNGIVPFFGAVAVGHIFLIAARTDQNTGLETSTLNIPKGLEVLDRVTGRRVNFAFNQFQSLNQPKRILKEPRQTSAATASSTVDAPDFTPNAVDPVAQSTKIPANQSRTTADQSDKPPLHRSTYVGQFAMHRIIGEDDNALGIGHGYDKYGPKNVYGMKAFGASTELVDILFSSSSDLMVNRAEATVIRDELSQIINEGATVEERSDMATSPQ